MITGILIILPLLFSLVVFSLKDEKWIRRMAVTGSVLEFLVSLYGLFLYSTQCHCQLLLNIGWIESLHISFRFGLDGISLLLVLLTTFLTPLIILSSLDHPYRKPSAFYGLILLMEMAFIGVFSASDGLLFYIFWEMALIPAYFICAVWGGNDRIRITFKFFIYTFTGSLFMLVALIYLYLHTPAPHSFEITYLYAAHLTAPEQIWIFAAFFLAFAIKIPIFPFHSWQPDTYTEAPAGGTMLLAGIMLKMGTYGLIRFVLPICPVALKEWGWIALTLSVIGIIYASVIAIRQSDLKRFIAYVSIAHVGLISAGIFALTPKALEGAVIQMVSHGINITGILIIISLIEKRMKTREIPQIEGMANRAPWLAALFMILLLGSIGLPLTNGFIGEFLLLLGIFERNVWMAAIAGMTIILSAVYMLRMYQRTMLGKLREESPEISDISLAEAVPLIPLVIMVIWIGIFPNFFLQLAEPAIREIMNLIHG
ncbi:MAG: NADH-quinone oxidoreductase subunit M [Bacteroidetes bacterium]|nr:NADH-quinone oxidoreductase subunit M [Bacteroidota bacterium]